MGRKKKCLLISLIDVGYRRAGRNAHRLVGRIVEGKCGLILRHAHAHARIRIENGSSALHDDEIVVIRAFGPQIKIDIQRMVLVKVLILKHGRLLRSSGMRAHPPA